MATEKINICTDSGKIVEATAPVIISASRSTDIPSGFLTAWLKAIALGTIHSTSKRCISLLVSVGLLYFGQRIQNL